MKTLVYTFVLFVITLTSEGLSQNFIENLYPVNVQIPQGTAQAFYVPISGIPVNAPIVNVEAKFSYIAFNGVENLVSVRFNKGSNPGTSGGIVLVSQGSLPPSNGTIPRTFGYFSYSQWNGTAANSNYYFRFACASGFPSYNPTIDTIWAKISYAYIDITYPTGGQVWNSGSNYTITWNKNQNVTGNIQIDLYKADTNFRQIAASAPNTGSYNFNLWSDLPQGSDYKIGISAMGGTCWDLANNFTINALPINPPSLNSPIDGSTIQDLTPDLTWLPVNNANYFHGQVSTNSSFTNIVQQNSNIAALNWTPTLTQYTTYYWRIRAHGTNGTWSNWSNVWSFTVSNAPTLIAPSQSANVQTEQITFQWTPVSGATSYELLVDNNFGLGSPEISSRHLKELIQYTNSSYTISGNWLPQNVYYWQVTAVFPGNVRVPSVLGTFTYSPTPTASPLWVPIYRAYKPEIADHFYCTSIPHLVHAIDSGYVFEKVEGYVTIKTFQAAGNLASIFRFYDKTNKSHYYTISDTKRDSIIAYDVNSLYEGITGYTYRNCAPGQIKFYSLSLQNPNPNISDNFYTTSEVEKNLAISRGYVYKGVTCYVNAISDSFGTEPWSDMQISVGDGINSQNGNFNSYSKSSFSIPGARMSLDFSHIYNSFSTRLITPINPLGMGWTHSYSAYLFQGDCNDIYVFWPGGGYHVYNKTTLAPVTAGVYDILSRISSSRFQVKKKDQMLYTFDILNPATDSTAFLTQIKDRNNNYINCNYDVPSKRITNITTSENRSLTFTYYTETDKTHLIKNIVDPMGRTIRFEYDADQNLIKFTDAQNQVTQYQYDPNARYDHLLTKVILPKGNSLTNTYANKKIISQTGGAVGITNLSYNNLNTIVSQGGTQFTYIYTSQKSGLISQIMSSFGSSSQFYYEDNQNRTLPTRILDGNSNQTSISYDLMGNTRVINRPLGIKHEFIYNSFNDVTKYIDPRFKEENYGYDGNGNLTSVQTPRGSTQITYNSNGTISSVRDPLNQLTSIGYNSYGNVTSITNNLGHSTGFTYDIVSRKLSMTNPAGQTFGYTYDNNDNLKTYTQSGVTTNYNYDFNDNIQSTVNAASQTTSYGYNNKDLLTSVTNPMSQQISLDYWDNELLKSKTKPGGQILNYTYDSKGRLSNLSGTLNASFTYDNNDNLQSVNESPNGNTGYTYDAVNRITSCTDFYGNTVSYGYDAAGNITSITYPGNRTVIYGYYDDNLLRTVTDWNNRTTTYNYRVDGTIDYVQMPNGTITRYTYDNASRLTGMNNKKSNGEVINSYTYVLDNVGNHTSVNLSEPYPAPYLPNSNTSYTYNNANRILTAGTYQYQHDLNGNMTQRKGVDTINFSFDGENRLLSTSGSLSTSHVYDISGNRRSSTRNGLTTRYVLDVNSSMSKVLMEKDVNGNVLNYYIYGLGLIERVKADGITTHYYHSDSRGSVISITDQNQNITHKYSYGPFGEILQSNEQDANPFKYVGAYGVMDEGKGLYFMRARYYDSKMGRFLAEDPVWNFNLYPYADNNPITRVDPDGLITKEEQIHKIFGYVGYAYQKLGKSKYSKYVNHAEYLYYLFRVTRFFVQNIRNDVNFIRGKSTNMKTTDSYGTIIMEGLKLSKGLLGKFLFFKDLEEDFIIMMVEMVKSIQYLNSIR